MKRRDSIIVAVLIVLSLLAFAFVQLQKAAKISEIISDEARWDALDSLTDATQTKVVILQDGMVARYVSEDETTFTCGIQDSFTVPKNEAHVELWSAADGKGIVCLKVPGVFPSYSKPDPSSVKVQDLVYEEGYVPDTYKCLGLKDGWFKIEVGEKPAYIEAKYVNWDAIDTF